MATTLRMYYRLPAVATPPVVVTPPVVTPPTLSSIGINGATQQNEGATVTRTFTAVYSNGTTAVSPAGGVWSTNSPGGVLAIPTNSVVGDSRTVTVTVDFGGKRASFDVQVVDTSVVVPPSADKVYGEIPFLPYRGVVEDNAAQYFGGYTNGDLLDNNSDYLYSGLIPNARIILSFPFEYECEFTEVWLGDGQQSSSTPLATTFIGPDGKTEIAGPAFLGENYGVFNKYVLPSRVRADYYYFRKTYPLPTEVKFFGYRRPVEVTPWVRTAAPAQNYCGVVTYPYDYDYPSKGGLNPAKLAILDSAQVYREYIDLGGITHLNESVNPPVPSGLFTFQPMFSGYWQLDDQLANRKAAGKISVLCLKGGEGSPAYLSALEQIGIRYLNNQSESLRPRVKINTAGPSTNEVKIGMNLTRYVQIGNEPVRWWKGLADLVNQTNLEGMMTPAELADMWAAAAVILRGIDPNVYIIGSGMSTNKPAFIIAMKLRWRATGVTVCPVNAWAYHEYNNTEGGQNQTGGEPAGQCPEMAGMQDRAEALQQVLHEQFPGESIELWITETGYSVQDPAYNQNNIAKTFPDRNNKLTQADWSIRTVSVAARKALRGMTFYQGYDDGGVKDKPNVYWPWDATCGIWEEDAQHNLSLRPTGYKLLQFNDLLHDYYMTVPASYPPANGVMEDLWQKQGSPDVLALVSPTESRTTVQYAITVPAGGWDLVRLADYSKTPIRIRLPAGQQMITVTEDTCFVVKNNLAT